MIIDAQNEFSSAQAITAAANSTNIVDLGQNRDIGTGQSLYIVVGITTTMTDSGSDSTITVALEGDSTTSFTPDGTQNLFVIPAVSTAGTIFIARLDPGSAPLQFRFIRLLYTPANGNLSAGAFDGHIVHDIQRYTAYADNITIS